MKKMIGTFALFFSIASFAATPAVDDHPGAELFDDNCASGCHFHTTDELFVRKDRKATDRVELSKWVSRCLSQLKIEMFPEEEEQVEEYLSLKYYKY